MNDVHSAVYGEILVAKIVGFRLHDAAWKLEALENLNGKLGACPSYKAAKDDNLLIESPLTDGFVLAFHDAPNASAACASELLDALRDSSYQVRIGIANGTYAWLAGLGGKPVASGACVDTALALGEIAAPRTIAASAALAETLRLSGWLDRIEPIGRREIEHGRQLMAFRVLTQKQMEEREHAGGLHGWIFRTAKKKLAGKHGKHELIGQSVVFHRLEELLKSAAVGFLIVCVVTTAHVLLDRSSVAERPELLAYDLLMRGRAAPAEEPLVLIDISQLPKVPDPANLGSPWTDRSALRDILRELQPMNPAAVAVDIDVGVQGPISVVPGDDDLHKFAKSMGHVYLGVDKAFTQSSDPAYWLDGLEYEPLAVHGRIPPDTRFALSGLTIAGKEIPSVAGALADAYNGSHPANRDDPFYAETFQPAGGDPALGAKEYLIDVSVVRRLLDEQSRQHKSHPILYTISKPEDVQGLRNAVQGNLVLIGDLRSPDFCVVPSVDQAVPGAFFQAAAACTLVKGGPLMTFKFAAQLLIDILAGMLVLGGSIVIRWAHITHPYDVSEHGLESLLTAVLVAFVWLACIALIVWLRVLWLDFLLLTLVLVSHGKVGAFIRRATPVAWREFLVGVQQKIYEH